MMIDFKWHKDKRLKEQLEFFGAKKKGFISCYAKQVKPKIRIEIKKESTVRVDLRNTIQDQMFQQIRNNNAMAQGAHMANERMNTLHNAAQQQINLSQTVAQGRIGYGQTATQAQGSALGLFHLQSSD